MLLLSSTDRDTFPGRLDWLDRAGRHPRADVQDI
jgi:hypothetical protein